MASFLTVNFKDINGQSSHTSFWCNDTLTAVGAVQALANLSNAQVVSAYLTSELDVTLIDPNTAVAANIENAGSKAKARLRAPDGGSVAAPNQYVTVSVPAPKGEIINATGQPNDPNGLMAAFVGVVQSNTGLATTEITHVYYSHSK